MNRTTTIGRGRAIAAALIAGSALGMGGGLAAAGHAPANAAAAVLAGSGDNTPDTVQDKFPIIRDTDDARAFDGLFY